MRYPPRCSLRFAAVASRSSRLRRHLAWLLLGLALFVGPAVSGQLPAFPGAEGFGRFAAGGRGGEVYHVTHLQDRGPGSFRDAVSRPNRTIIFEVGGVIRLSSRVSISPNLTLAGQTAPGDGVVIHGNGVSFSGANHTITRFLRFRMGVEGDRGRDALTIAGGHDMIFDHISVSWGRDENFSVSGPVTNITLQDSIIAQGLQPHSAGGLIQTAGGVSILRTLYIDNHTRNPKVKGVNQFVNNVVYNWGGGGSYILGDSEGPSFANVINNYFINGPSSSVAAFSRGNLNFRLYAAGNFQDADKNGALDGTEIPKSSYGVVSWREEPFDYPAVTTRSPLDAWKTIVNGAGASLHRDAVDERLIAELCSAGALGQTITRESDPPMNGVGAIRNGPAPADSDRDGLPDAWELAVGLNAGNPEDRNQSTAAGYTQLEQYLNWLAAPHAIALTNSAIDVDLSGCARGSAGRSPVFSVFDAVHGSVTLVGGQLARFNPDRDFAGPGSFRFAVVDADGSRFTNSVRVLVTPRLFSR